MNIRSHRGALYGALVVALIALAIPVYAVTRSITLQPGDVLTVRCATRIDLSGSSRQRVLTCAAAAPTPTPTTPSTDVGRCGEPLDRWHPPIIDSCATGHEHGDAPPDWVTAAGYDVSFHGPFNTSHTEHTAKHAAMKGFATRFGNVDVYFRIHAASNVLDRSARYHSYQIWARDSTGAVSHWQGWVNFGDPVADRVPRTQPDPLRRPVMLVIDQASYDAGTRCEQWYSAPAQPIWGWDFGWTICNSTTLYYQGENQEQDRSFWRLSPDGTRGTTRRLEAAWYANRSHPTGRFFATQFGEIVSGPSAPRCSATTTRFGTTYQNVCLEQLIAPTMQQVSFPGNAVQKSFDSSGLDIPN